MIANKTVKCWGGNSNGDLGNGSNISSSLPVQVSGLSNVSEMGSGRSFTCAKTGDQASCWGNNLFGSLGDGVDAQMRNVPGVVPLPAAVRHLTVGSLHACVQLVDDSLWCWGGNQFAELGTGNLESSFTPVPVRW